MYIKTQSVPRSKHTPSIIKTSQLMLYREIIAVCSKIHTKHINTLCGQNVELLNVKLGGTYSDQWALQGYPKRCDSKQAVCVPFSSLLLHSALHFRYQEWVSGYQELVPVTHEHRCTATNNTWDRYRERDVTELLNWLETVVTFVYNTMTHNKLLVNYYASLLVGHL